MKVTASTKPTSGLNIKRAWHLIDLSGETLGRASNKIATLLQGKSKVNYVPNLDTGDYVVVINAKKVKISGRKATTKTYSSYSGYPGGMKEVTFDTLLEKSPDKVIRHAVSGMLPKNKHRDERLSRLYVYADNNHPHGDKLKK